MGRLVLLGGLGLVLANLFWGGQGDALATVLGLKTPAAPPPAALPPAGPAPVRPAQAAGTGGAFQP